MPIHDELASELKDAMRQRDRPRLDVIRQIETEVSRAKSEPGFSGEVDDDLYGRTIASYVKKMDKAREEFATAGERGKDAVDKLTFEIEYLSRWAPSGGDETVAREVVRVALMELRVTDPKQAGQVIGHIMKNGPKGLDGSLVSKLVREALGAA
ncbi:MAG: GatB/YqeY domain-containing protein [Actinomycetota bacterium]